jgi:hypothetical protein
VHIGNSARCSRDQVGAQQRLAAAIQLRLPRIVLISPLWAMYRYGWRERPDGNVFVENREWIRMIALSTRSSVRSG